MNFAAMVLIAALIDSLIGWPTPLYQRIGHPVTWLGAVIRLGEARLNTGTARQRFRGGLVLLSVSLAVILGLSVLLTMLLPDGALGVLIGGLLIWPLIAIRSMHDHVRDVAEPLTAADLAQARQAVSMIVGRDPAQLDETGISRAAIESLAENTSDGILAPVFWGVIAGFPGIAIYKAINTFDSMIAHRSERYEHFGKAAAHLDDAANWVPARLCGLLFALSRPSRLRAALSVMLRDASRHRSPNAGWPESAMAGALDIRLSGPRVYGTHRVEEPWLNASAPDPAPPDLESALSLYRRAIVLLLALLLLASTL